jgi:hypothetical protein
MATATHCFIVHNSCVDTYAYAYAYDWGCGNPGSE